jgi:hypothetical protein
MVEAVMSPMNARNPLFTQSGALEDVTHSEKEIYSEPMAISTLVDEPAQNHFPDFAIAE